MPSFTCQVCRTAFSVPPKTLERFPGWTPKFCREHSPRRQGGGAARNSRARSAASTSVEENLTLAQVLERYTEGPTSGIFTDGSASPNPGPGGWGVVWVVDGEVKEQRHGHDPATTNNRMELKALIEAHKLLPADAEYTIWTDSRLCVDTITRWAAGWEKRGWKRKGGEIKNLELVQELYTLAQEHPACELQWIAAHAGTRWNEYADSLSTAWLRDEL